MTSDCYAILGVTPTAEDVVIGAAYRALMRHYHPDTNSDPDARERAQEVAAAYSMLRDPEKRAHYDAQRAAGEDWWPVVEPDDEGPPPMRATGIATTLLAAALVGTVWLWPRSDLPPDKADTVASARQAHEQEVAPVKPTAQPAAIAALADPPVAPPVPPQSVDLAPDSPPPVPASEPVAPANQSSPARPPHRRAVQVAKRSYSPATAKDERVATLDRMSSSFFSQSMVNATDQKKQLLIAARDRSEAQRKACRSDNCVAEAYVRQIRETGEIMERPAEAKK